MFCYFSAIVQQCDVPVRKGVNREESFEAVSQAVGVGLKAVVSENTLKEEWIDENDFNDNYNYITIDNY